MGLPNVKLVSYASTISGRADLVTAAYFQRPLSPNLLAVARRWEYWALWTGVVGNLRALEAIKLITGLHGEEAFLERITLFSNQQGGGGQMEPLRCSFSPRSHPRPSGRSRSGINKRTVQRAMLGPQPSWTS